MQIVTLRGISELLSRVKFSILANLFVISFLFSLGQSNGMRGERMTIDGKNMNLIVEVHAMFGVLESHACPPFQQCPQCASLQPRST
jgi:hypothetical protein